VVAIQHFAFDHRQPLARAASISEDHQLCPSPLPCMPSAITSANSQVSPSGLMA